MRIGLMLRHLGRQPGGTGTYTNMMVSLMLAAHRNNEYVLLYDDPARLQSYTAHPNVTEVAVRLHSKLLWDQLIVPWLAWRYQVDVIFNLKMTAPFLAPCYTTCVQHGADWGLRSPSCGYENCCGLGAVSGAKSIHTARSMRASWRPLPRTNHRRPHRARACCSNSAGTAAPPGRPPPPARNP
jgi:hypothetical protein